MSEAVKILPNYTYQDYIHWEGKWELIAGIPYAMSPAPVPKHQRVGGNLFAEFRRWLKGNETCAVYQPIDYLVDDNTVLQPDMLVVCGEIKKKYLDFPPVLVVEVLSPATSLKDHHTKYEIYESQGVKYYLMISPDTEEVEVYGLTEAGKYELKKKGRDFEFDFLLENCTAHIVFREIW